MPKRALSVKLTGDKELKRKLEQLGRKAQSALLDAAEAGAAVIERDADQRAPGPHIITGNQEVHGGQASVDIGPDKEHWFYQFSETGATQHEIKGNPLVFEGDHGLVVTRKVDHPGMDARPFLRPAMVSQKENAKDEAGKVFKAEIDKLVVSNAD